jgi:diguanylate cyclase (GGDEF)-like protein
MRIVFITLAAVAAMAAGVFYTSHVQRETSETLATEAALTAGARADAVRVDSALNAYSLSGDPEMLEDRREADRALDRQLAAALEEAADDGAETAAVKAEIRAERALHTLIAGDLAPSSARARRAALAASATDRHRLTDDLLDANDDLDRRQDALARIEERAAARTAPLLVLGLGLLFGAAALLAMARSRRIARREARRHGAQERFGEAMQVSDSQPEAHGLLKSHLERTIAGSTITVINRNNSADRLEASTALEDDSPLGEALQQARPRSCMAVRLSRPFSQGGEDEVLTCELCGVVDTATTCQPLLVGGEVIGSVLAAHDRSLIDAERQQITQSVAQSAPVLANLRNLAIAETRAATDALTGLPNRRAVDDTLLRMLAQAGRSFTPLSVILLDLDHFKTINDTYGHDRGDEVLAAFATRLREVLRTSDFAGRSGGEEFVLFLPDTDRTGAVRLAEKVREAMRGLGVSGMEHDVTASFGVACFPDDAVDSGAIMRCADRALYAAKRGGRDRIEASSTGAPVKPAA